MYSSHPIEAADVKRGTKISCLINGSEITEATLQIENGIVFICQNCEAGDECCDKLGYNYSWSVRSIDQLEDGVSVREFFRQTDATEVKVLTREWDPKANTEKQNACN